VAGDSVAVGAMALCDLALLAGGLSTSKKSGELKVEE